VKSVKSKDAPPPVKSQAKSGLWTLDFWLSKRKNVLC